MDNSIRSAVMGGGGGGGQPLNVCMLNNVREGGHKLISLAVGSRIAQVQILSVLIF